MVAGRGDSDRGAPLVRRLLGRGVPVATGTPDAVQVDDALSDAAVRLIRTRLADTAASRRSVRDTRTGRAASSTPGLLGTLP
jgi:hypothetical protein